MRTRSYRWKGAELEALRRAYEADDRTVVILAADFKTSHAWVCQLAKKHGWRRRLGPRVALPEAARRQLKLYNKLRLEVGREAALAALADATS